jgi:two-component system alkaline phosphatase synthesis response regulator PhoP
MAKLLVVEDDELMLRMYTKLLSYVGFETVVAKDGEEGLAKAISEKPSLIILDIMMPKVNGLDVLKELKSKKETQNIPVVLLTNVSDDSVLSEAFKLGATGYLIKSQIANNELVEEIKQYLA